MVLMLLCIIIIMNYDDDDDVSIIIIYKTTLWDVKLIVCCLLSFCTHSIGIVINFEFGSLHCIIWHAKKKNER